MTDPEIRDALRRVVPDDLSVDGLADGARRRHATRTRAVAGAAALSLVALAVPVALTLQQVNAPSATPAEAPPTQPPATTPMPEPTLVPRACLRDWAAIPQPPDADIPTGVTIPTGAARAWLCGDASAGSPGWLGPMEPLEIDVDRVVTALVALPPASPDAMCTEEYRLTYHVVLEYDVGPERVVTGELHGCRTVRADDGDDVRTGGEGYLDTLMGLWEAQRATGVRVDPASTALCPGGHTSMLSVGTPVRGAVCLVAGDGSLTAHSELPKTIRVDVEDAVAAGEQGTPPNSAPDGLGPGFATSHLVLADAEGDRRTLWLDRQAAALTWEQDGEPMWAPIPASLADELAALVSAEPVPAPADPPLPMDPGQEVSPTPVVTVPRVTTAPSGTGSVPQPTGTQPVMEPDLLTPTG